MVKTHGLNKPSATRKGGQRDRPNPREKNLKALDPRVAELVRTLVNVERMVGFPQPELKQRAELDQLVGAETAELLLRDQRRAVARDERARRPGWGE
jgi:hypothetical protein